MRGIVAGMWLLLALSAQAKSIESRVVAVEIPHYPAVARRAKITGTVEVAASVDGSGATIAQVAKSAAPILDNAAVVAARQWQLRLGPGETVTLEFRFILMPPCSIPESAQIYTPPFTVEVLAAERLPWVDDGEQLTCPQVSVSLGSSQ